MSKNSYIPSERGVEEQMILRLPPQLAEQVRKMLRTKQFNEEMEFEFQHDNRNAQFRIGKKKYDSYLVDLPCILESHKTLDKTMYYKSADIGQMLIVKDPKDKQAPSPPPNYLSPDGVTPPTRDIQRRKWRIPPDPAQLAAIEAEVSRLLKPADNESVEILNAEDLDDMDDFGGAEDRETTPKENKIKIKMTPDGAMEAVADAEKEKKPKKERKKKTKGKEENGESAEKPAEKPVKKERKEKGEKPERKPKKTKTTTEKPEASDTAETPESSEKKPKKERKKKKKEEDKPEEAQENGDKEKKKKKRKPKAAAQPSTPSGPTSPSLAASTSAISPFPFAAPATITTPPPALPIAFTTPISTTKISTPVFNANPFAAANLSTPTHLNPTPITTPISAPIAVHVTAAAAPQDNAYNTLAQQKQKLAAEVEQLKGRVAEATNKYNILPNAILKARQETKLKEVADLHAQKVRELEAVEKQLAEAKR